METLLQRADRAAARLDLRMERVRFLTGNELKLFAVSAMVIDHTCKIVLQWLLTDYWGVMVDNRTMSWERFTQIDTFIRFDLQSIGTAAFPLFCFLLAEGFLHTRSKKRYLGLMAGFALLSEIPFDIGFFSRYSLMEGTFPFYLRYQNVFFTLFFGLAALICLERFSAAPQSSGKGRAKSLCLQLVSVAVLAAAAELLRADYGMAGVLYIAAFYVCRRNRLYQVLLFLLAYTAATDSQPPLGVLFACLLILLYNGRRGKHRWKYGFYLFYPLHILVLYAVTLLLAQVLAV